MGVINEAVLAEKLARVRPHVNERQWRLLLGAEALALGRGGIAAVARASGASRTTVQAGVAQMRAGVEPDGRVRAVGAGRRPVEVVQPGIVEALDALVSPTTRGDPCSPLRWTTKSLTQLATALSAQGFQVGKDVVRKLLRAAGYRLQSVFKTKEGGQHPDRDAQFGFINTLAGKFLATGDPVISVDTKKKELVGEFANKGREYQPTGAPIQVNGHDFPAGVPKAIPYGVYDVGADTGFVSVGIDADTAAFAVNAIRTWWNTTGSVRYPQARRLLITADCGGSNGNRVRAFKRQLSVLAAEIRLPVTVCHFPPGTSKWNKIEHRLFSFISINWRGRPLTDYQTIVETIAATTTATGLTVEAVLDTGSYPTGVKVSDAEMNTVPVQCYDFHPEWNYRIYPTRIPESVRDKPITLKRTI